MRKTYWTPAAASILALAALGGCDNEPATPDVDVVTPTPCTVAQERAGDCVRVYPDREDNQPAQP